MRDNLGRITKVLLWVMFAIAIIFIVFYFVNLEMIDAGIDTMWASRMLKYSYVLTFIAAAVAILAALVNFVLTLISDPKKAIKSIVMIGALGGIILIANIMASSEVIDMPNYDGEDNVPGTLKAVGTALYTMYFLFGLAILATLGSAVAKVFK